MSLKARLAITPTPVAPVMYSAEGAMFQEWALSNLDLKGSVAHQSIGRLVTAINNGYKSVTEAKSEFVSLRK